jgi:expansin (peptidoglycan-binding protein)
MNYRITFSTYVNADSLNLGGFNLADSTGYYLKTVEPSHALTLYDVAPEQAREFATLVKSTFKQLEVILEKLPDTEVEFI